MTRPNKSVMSHRFSEISSAEIPRSSFNRSHGYKTTLDAGYLVPIFMDEALPGDTFNLKMTGFSRIATPLHPFMDNLFMNTFFFAVPVRLLWDDWQKFHGEQTNPGDSTDYDIPTIQTPPTTGSQAHSLDDYFGIPTDVPNLHFSVLWHRAYNMIWNHWFRDENLQDSQPENKGQGPDSSADYKLLRRGKRHDYFTSALPWPQKGPAVGLPLGIRAPVSGIGFSDEDNNNGPGTIYETEGPRSTTVIGSAEVTANILIEADTDLGPGGWPNIYADLSAATAATINQLRQAFQIQKLYERDSRGGTRYTEIIRSHFGVTSPDARLQRPEFLGGGQSAVVLTPVAQTSGGVDASDDTPQANLAAFGTAVLNNHGFTKSFTEHCILLGLVSVRADLNYQNGLNRMFSRQTRWDYFYPALSHIGEQAIFNKEIFALGLDTPGDEDVFGYQERYAEYRYKPSVITGLFRSTYTESLDTWHLAQDFASTPVLNNLFIEDNPPIDRVIAVPGEPHFLFDAYFDLQCARPMPLYGVPGMIDHF